MTIDAPSRFPDPDSRAHRLLLVGALVGMALALWAVLEPGPAARDAMPGEAAATVDGAVILRSDYDRAVQALATDSRNPIGDEQRRHVLDRLIEEELLVQRAMALGFDHRDRAVRKTLVSAMIEMILSGVPEDDPTPAELEAFYAENADFFARTDRLWVRQLRIPIAGDEARAEAVAAEAADRLRSGESIGALEEELGTPSIIPVPDGLLPAAKLRDYIGPTAARAAFGLGRGEVSEPIPSGAYFLVLKMVERERAPALPLSEVADSVRAEMRRRAGDDALRDYLDDLRRRADVRIDDS